jgi:hypothetical protein
MTITSHERDDEHASEKTRRQARDDEDAAARRVNEEVDEAMTVVR